MSDKYILDRYKGKRIRCSDSDPCKLSIIQTLYVMIYKTSKIFKRPLGLHVRVRFTERMQLSSFSARLNTNYERHFGYKPIRVVAKETDPKDPWSHYHIALIIDGQKSTIQSVRKFLWDMKCAGFVADYCVIPPDSDPFGLKLDNELGRDAYFRWMTYITKNETKKLDKQSFSTCKSVQKDFRVWMKEGQPDLTETFVTLSEIYQPSYNAFKGGSAIDLVGLHSLDV